ncbi:MAG: lipopolysaccharide biosynthesis protein [Thermodesulfovibrionales bacterium]
MSFARKAAKSGLWFTGFRTISQTFSWIITIVIARILVPEDYGLMSMASILTGYVAIFSELGLGAAIIQKQDISKKELSSIFWFSMIVGTLFSIVSFGLAYPTAWIFNEPRIIPITQLISVLFIIGATMIVPYNILTRDVRFKEIGLIQMIAIIISSLSMLLMAKAGYGVWTLIHGTIIQRCTNVMLIFIKTKWCPQLHFNFREVTSFLTFGLNVAGSSSLFYLFQKSDKFIVGKMFNAQYLGFYSFAMQLASIPTEKIVSIVSQVSFPVFSRYQNDLTKCKDMYLRLIKYIALMVAPLFFGGAFWGEEIIFTFLGDKWMPITFVFRLICLSQFVISVTVINNIIHNAQGRPQWVLIFHSFNAILLPAAIFVAGKYGFNALAIPWVTIYPAVCIIWTWITLRKLEIPVVTYLKAYKTPLLATAFMIVGVKGFYYFLTTLEFSSNNFNSSFLQKILLGSIFYLSYLMVFEKKAIKELWNLRKG